MNSQLRHKTLAEQATKILKNGLPLKDLDIEGDIKIEINGNWNKEVIIENCTVENFSGSVTHFEKTVQFLNTHFKNCTFVFSYFAGGLVIENCTFDNYLDFQAGGHNKADNPIIIKNNGFKEFVNFFDCWYNGQISVVDNKFHKGTNVESEKQLITFDIPPLIKNNFGQTNIESEFAVEET